MEICSYSKLIVGAVLRNLGSLAVVHVPDMLVTIDPKIALIKWDKNVFTDRSVHGLVGAVDNPALPPYFIGSWIYILLLRHFRIDEYFRNLLTVSFSILVLVSTGIVFVSSHIYCLLSPDFLFSARNRAKVATNILSRPSTITVPFT